jgi:hypothetical protein
MTNLGHNLRVRIGDNLQDPSRHDLRRSFRDRLGYYFWYSLQDSLWNSFWGSLRVGLQSSLEGDLAVSWEKS